MFIDKAAFRIAIIGLIAPLAACDPGVHLAVEQDFDGPVDYDCVEKALRVVAKDVRRGSYQADGSGPRGFPNGLTVTQFNYSAHWLVDIVWIWHFCPMAKLIIGMSGVKLAR
jgi:hypothetical protein